MIVFDVEIEKAILGRGEAAIEGIDYCNGWRDFAGMGVSVVTTYDINTHLTRVFLKEDLPELFEYLRDKPTAGFNTKRFDIPLLAHHWLALGLVKDKDSIGCPHYDILEAIWLSLGLNPDKFVPQTHGGWGLDAVCQATLGIAKTGNGALAPVWWQQGRRGKVIDYCCNDSWMEGQLLRWIIENEGWVSADRGPNRQSRAQVALPPLEWLQPQVRLETHEYKATPRSTSTPASLMELQSNEPPNPSYWLCCGGTDYNNHPTNCPEATRGRPSRCRWGTTQEHAAWLRGQA